MQSQWKNPEKETPKFGSWIIIRETVDIDPKNYNAHHKINPEPGRVSYRATIYSSPLVFDVSDDMKKKWNLKITYWMYISEPTII